MPRPKTIAEPEVTRPWVSELQHAQDGGAFANSPPGEARTMQIYDGEEGYRRALLKWVGDLIRTVNANGKRSDKFCVLCKLARQRRMPCRHAEIWELTK